MQRTAYNAEATLINSGRYNIRGMQEYSVRG